METQSELYQQEISMSRINDLFSNKDRKILNVYCTAGYPEADSTMKVINALQANGADLIELGMPYSDPLADGPVIQASSAKALHNGMTISKLFGQLKELRKPGNPTADHGIPVVLMGYLNPLLQYGFEKFCAKAAEVGIDGLIIPDMPMYEYENEYREVIKQHGLDFVFLITPETSDQRIRQLDELSSGFLYAVSSSSITGTEKDFSAVEAYLKRLKDLKLKNRVLVGFGIKDRATFETACKYANGAIIGSAYIKAIENGNVEERTKEFLEGILRS
jgi:tryptophan synthase alpha chain